MRARRGQAGKPSAPSVGPDVALRAITRPDVLDEGVGAMLDALRGVLDAAEVRLHVVVDGRPSRAWRASPDGVEVLGRPGPVPELLTQVPLRRPGISGTLAADVSATGAVEALRYVVDDLAAAVLREVEGQATERRLRLGEVEAARLALVMRTAPDGLVLINGDGLVVAWNPAMRHLTGIGEEAALLRSLGDVLMLHDAHGVPCGPAGPPVLASVRSGADAEARDVLGLVVAGQQRWLEIAAARASASTSVVVVVRDVTAKRDLDRLKDDFLTTVSHEVRTPLTPLKAAVDLLGQRGPEGLRAEDLTEILDSMRRQVARLDRLVEDFITLADVGEQLVEDGRQAVDVRGLLTTLLDGRPPAAAGRVQVVDGDRVAVLASRAGLARVLDALLDNALLHTDGPVHVEAGVDPASPGMGRVVVRDQGPGIAAGDVATAFEPFGRLGSHLRRSQGAGLGLPIARAICERMGATVELASTPGVGTSVALRLPIA